MTRHMEPNQMIKVIEGFKLEHPQQELLDEITDFFKQNPKASGERLDGIVAFADGLLAFSRKKLTPL